MKKKYTIQWIFFKTFEAEDEEDACFQCDDTSFEELDLDAGSTRVYEGEYNYNLYQEEANNLA